MHLALCTSAHPATIAATLARGQSPTVRRMLRSEAVEAAARDLIELINRHEGQAAYERAADVLSASMED